MDGRVCICCLEFEGAVYRCHVVVVVENFSAVLCPQLIPFIYLFIMLDSYATSYYHQYKLDGELLFFVSSGRKRFPAQPRIFNRATGKIISFTACRRLATNLFQSTFLLISKTKNHFSDEMNFTRERAIRKSRPVLTGVKLRSQKSVIHC